MTHIHRHGDGWVDVFLGQTHPQDPQRRSILDGRAKVGVHYRPEDSTVDWTMAVPCGEIPRYLWAELQGVMVNHRDA